MDESDLLQMMRRLDCTRYDFAKKIGVSTRTLDRYLSKGAPKRILHAANWVYLKEMGREYR